MDTVRVDTKAAESFVTPAEAASFRLKAERALARLTTTKDRAFLGWLHLPSLTEPDLILNIEAVRDDWARDIELVVVAGIGGSYLGAKAIIEALSHSFAPYLKPEKGPRVVFAGQNISEDYLHELFDLIDKKQTACIVISKSGTTTEPAIAFRLIKKHIEKTYGKVEARRRIVAVTDASRGALRTLADREGYRSFIIPDNVGGRFSVLSPVGLLPVAVAGFDIRRLLQGARDMEERCSRREANPAIAYAAIRNALYAKGKKIELLVNFQPKLHYFGEWWKQLFGESEGKENKGIFPAAADFTTDLHSLGQYIQEGERILFETAISVASTEHELTIEEDEQNLDGLNYLSGKHIDTCNKMAELGTRLAHTAGGVPTIRIEIPSLDAHALGALLFFFEKACGISGYILGVNPFNQEGVEAYKKNMFALLDKPGYEEAGRKLREKL